MKKLKKVLSLLIAAAMVLAAGTTVFAADGELTVNGTTEGKTYDIYKIFDLTKEAGGTGVAYTVDSDWENFFFNGGPGSAYVTTTQTPGLNTLTYKGTTYYINITDSNVARLAQDALKYAAAKTPDASKTADNSGSVKFTNLDLGYYLVYPKGATDIKDNYASICSLTSTNPSAAVNVKAKYPVIDKEVDNQDVQVGQKVTFTVKGKVPDTTGYTTYKYEIKDTMSSGLTFNSTTANFSVKFGGSNISVAPVYSGNGFTLTFDMTQYQAYKGQEITVTYQAVVNKDAVATLTKNSATLTYSNDPSDSSKTETTPPVEKEVYTSKIVVDKYDAGNPGKKLSGASFILVKKTGGVETFYKYDEVTDTVSWVADKNDATVKTTDNTGAASFIGLSDGDYYLRETVAPHGFNLLDHDIKVTILHTTTTVGGKVFNIGVSQKSEIPNKTGTTLPETGGIGTTIFYVVGSLLLTGAVVVLIARRRMKRER